MVDIFFGTGWVGLLATICVILLIVVAGLLVYHRRMIRYKNRGIYNQIRERSKCEEQLNKALIVNLDMHERLQQTEAIEPELYLLATKKPITASFTKNYIKDNSFKIYSLRTVEIPEE